MKRLIFALCLTLVFPIGSAHGAEAMIYKDSGIELEGYWQPSACKSDTPVPTVLIVHQWMGVTDNEKMRAGLLAKECYNAFALDMYGKGIRPANTDEAGKLATLYKNDPVLARKRLTAALDFVKQQPKVDAKKIAIIGYCFGGTMALELARSGAGIKGAVSFHGALLTKAPVTKPGVIRAAIQIHHGAEDPLVPQEEIHGFMQEMKTADADWELTQYAHAVHAFTQKEAGNDPSKGFAYNAKADTRSWTATLDFLKEIFGNA
jgi:dienelactone hydrolase